MRMECGCVAAAFPSADPASKQTIEAFCFIPNPGLSSCTYTLKLC
jgi:hypothetical protein